MKDTRAWAAFCFGDLNDLNDDDDPSQSYEEEDPVINFEVENGRINNESHNEGVELMRHLKRRKLELSRRQDDDETRWKGEVNVAPTVTLLAQFDQVLSQRLLGMHTEWVLKGYLPNILCVKCFLLQFY